MKRGKNQKHMLKTVVAFAIALVFVLLGSVVFANFGEPMNSDIRDNKGVLLSNNIVDMQINVMSYVDDDIEETTGIDWQVLSENFDGKWVPDPDPGDLYTVPVGWDIEGIHEVNPAGLPRYWARFDDFMSAYVLTRSKPYSAGLWWSFDAQDEWLISPELDGAYCYNIQLEFYSYYTMNSVEPSPGSHDYIKVSTDGGGTWDIVADLCLDDEFWFPNTAHPWWNKYEYPVVIDLGAYHDSSFMIAFNYCDALGVRKGIWMVDDVVITADLICPPEIPGKPSGPPRGKLGSQYFYTTNTTDYYGDRIFYNFSWGDGTYSGWIGPYDSGQTAGATHTWSEKGTYEIKVKAKDVYGEESDWSEPLRVAMSKNTAANYVSVAKISTVTQTLEIGTYMDMPLTASQMLGDGNPAFDGPGDQLHPGFGRTTSGTHMAAYKDDDFSQIYWSFSTDDGGSYDPGVHYGIKGDYPSIKLWNDTRFFGTLVCDPSVYNGAMVFLFECNDPTDTDTYVMTGWDLTGWEFHDMIDADIACDNSKNPGEWGISSYVISSFMFPDRPIIAYANPDDPAIIIVSVSPIKNCAHTDIDIDHENITAYVVYDQDEFLTGDWRLLCEVKDFENLSGYDEFFTVTGGGNLRYPAVAVDDDNLVILAETDENGNKDIICLYSDEGISNLQTSFIANSTDDEMYPDVRHVEGTTFVCTFVKNEELYSSITRDGGVTWSDPLRVAEDVVEEYKTVDICEYAAKGMWEVDNGEDIDIHVGEVDLSIDWWPMFRHDLRNSGYSSSTAPDTNNMLWSYTTGSGGVDSCPSVVDGRVFIGSWYYMYCLDEIDGSLIWRYYIDDNNMGVSSAAVSDGKVYFGCNDYNVYCLNAQNGSLIWNYTTGLWVRSSPVVADGKVYVGSTDHNVYCLNAENGIKIWNYTTGGGVESSPAVVDGKVYVGSTDYNVYCLNAQNGSLIWRYRTGEGWAAVSTSPSVVDGKVFVGSWNKNVYCLDAQNGSLIWNYTTGGRVWESPAVAYGKVYIGSDDHNVYCLDAQNGSLIWNYIAGSWVDTSIAVADGKVYFASWDYNLYCLNAMNGSLIWKYIVGNHISWGHPSIADGKIFVGSGRDVYCLGSQLDTIPPTTTHDFDGDMGENGWYVSDVHITLTAEDDKSGVRFTYYRIDGGIWEEYNAPVVVADDGEHTLGYYSVDNVGNEELPQGPFNFKIDQTDPTIELYVEKIGFRKWLLTATVSDATSGVDRVEFYYDDELLGEVTDAPFEWIYSGSYGENATVVVYDNAGNLADDEKPVSYSQLQSSSSVYQVIRQTTKLWGGGINA